MMKRQLRKIRSESQWDTRDPQFADIGTRVQWVCGALGPSLMSQDGSMFHYGVCPHTSHSKAGGEERSGGQFLYPPSSLISTHGEETFSRSYLANTFFVVIFNPGSDTHVRKPGFSNVLGKCTLTLGDKQEGGGWEWLWVDPQEQSHLLIKHLE